jgi:putative hydrolase of the HAD superfamily
LIDQYRAIIFDLDGTLTEEKVIWSVAVRSAIKSNALALKLSPAQAELLPTSYAEVSDAAWAAYTTALAHFASTEQIRIHLWTKALAQVGVTAEPSAVARLVSDFAVAQLNLLCPDSTLTSLLTRLSLTHRLGVCTNGRYCDQVVKLKRLGVLELFSRVVCGVDLGMRKPDPRIFRAAAAGLGCDPTECVFVGNDLALDIVPARAVGMGVVWITDGGATDGATVVYPTVSAALADLLGDQ